MSSGRYTVEDTTNHTASVSCTLAEIKAMGLTRVYAVAAAMRPGTTRVFSDGAGRRLRLRRHA